MPMLKFLLEHVLPLHLEKSHTPKSLSCCLITHAKHKVFDIIQPQTGETL